MVVRKCCQNCAAETLVSRPVYIFPIIFFLLLIYSNLAYSQWQSNVLLDLRATDISGAENSWLAGGLDATRIDESSEHLLLGQAIVEARWQFADALSVQGFVSAYEDGGDTVGVNELFIDYRPVPLNGYRFNAKVGAFYPAISLENTKTGWTSSGILSNSAINTWLGEELRILGSEVSVTRLGRAHRSDWDLGGSISVYGGNDPTTALLAWRGWGIHDRQVRLGEKISFAELPVIGVDEGFSSQSEDFDPFVEVDDRPGYALSLWAAKKRGLKVKLYYYDNRADPKAIRQGQYAWHTKFHHISVWLPLNNETTLLSQWLKGKTNMGEDTNIAVRADYQAWYVGLRKQWRGFQFTLRYDDFEVEDLDITFMDNNNQDGRSWTFAASYVFNQAIHMVFEHHRFKENNYARRYFSLPINNDYQQSQVALQWRF